MRSTRNSHSMLEGVPSGTAFGDSLAVLCGAKYTADDPAIPLLGTHPSALKTLSHKSLYTDVYGNFIHPKLESYENI